MSNMDAATYSLTARARDAVVTTALEMADAMAGIALDPPMSAYARLRDARRVVRAASLSLFDQMVMLELIRGASWDEVASALGLDVDTARYRYEETLEQWRVLLDE